MMSLKKWISLFILTISLPHASAHAADPVEEAVNKALDSLQKNAPDSDEIIDLKRLDHFQDLWAEVDILFANLLILHKAAQVTGLKGEIEGEYWAKLFRDKIIPEFKKGRALTVVIGGGTKTGKSTVTNAIVGGRVSTTSHIGGATKQSVALVPPGFYDKNFLKMIFEGLEVEMNAVEGRETVETGEKYLMLAKSIKTLPENMMLLDIPDVDSTEQHNWEKARRIARASDVMIAMISPEKHKDAAVIEYFKEVAAASNKPVIVVVNKINERQWRKGEWQDWLKVFCQETGITPIQAYAVPTDNDDEVQPKFHRISVKGESDLAKLQTGQLAVAETSVALVEELRKLPYAELKHRAQVGALSRALEGGVDGKNGLIEYLELIQRRSESFRRVKDRLNSADAHEINWPPPDKFVGDALAEWWDKRHRSGVVKLVKSVTDFVGVTWLTFGGREAKVQKEAADHKLLEAHAIQRIVSDIVKAVKPIFAESSEHLNPQIRAIVDAENATAAAGLVSKRFSESRDPIETFRMTAEELLPKWEKEHPAKMALLHTGDFATQIVLRPVITIAASLASFIFATPGASVGVSAATGAGSGALASRLLNTLADGGGRASTESILGEISDTYSERQIAWVRDLLAQEYFPGLHEELNAGAELDRSEAFHKAQVCAKILQAWTKLQ